MNWARGSGSISNHGSNVGLFAVKVSSKDNKIEIKDGSASQFGGGGSTDTNWYRIHGICLYCLWGIFSFMMIVSGRHC